MINILKIATRRLFPERYGKGIEAIKDPDYAASDQSDEIAPNHSKKSEIKWKNFEKTKKSCSDQ